MELDEEEEESMLAETVKRWTEEWYQEGRQEGAIATLRDLVTLKFGAEVAAQLPALLEGLSEADRIDVVAAAVIQCNTGEEFIARTRGAPPQSSAPPTSSRSAGTAAPRLRRQVEGVEALMGLAPRTQREGKPFARAQVERRARFHAQVVEVQSRLRGDVARPLRLGKPAAPRPLPVDACRQTG